MAISAPIPGVSGRRFLRSGYLPGFSLGALLLAAGWPSTLPPAVIQGPENAAVLRPDATPAPLRAGAEDTGAQVLRGDPGGGVWVMTADERISRIRYYHYPQGALYVGGGLAPAGCSAWLQT